MSTFPFDGPPSVSFEFFPPNTPRGWELLDERIEELVPLEPSFVSVTYGAGGSTRTRTHQLVERLLTDGRLKPVPHLTCLGHTRADIDEILDRYLEGGVEAILALRGDPPSDGSPSCEGDFRFASDLVRYIRDFADRHGTELTIGVAGFPEGHPDTPDSLLAMDHLRMKVDAGAGWICSQLFFDNHAYLDWLARCRLAGIDVPILAGIMPVTTINGLRRMSSLAAGAVFPAPLLRAIERAEDGDEEAIGDIGVHWATEQCRDLLDREVDGIHFYTLNKSTATLRIHRTLGVRSSRNLRGS